ncbi:hypothetical protein [Desulfotignum phosphitoxidans]|uniref:Uncharacterized protein n=1 Tax=Desulfotignum phosphitoxidans DSM 13687 TaxID=1286635 RepID=S0FVY1_9BACT|nr:hypothetical protein [Desulfotignum phosphitoxidans]EMS79208.1 hypothetical protein Dpo_5c01310 [Desulfotignum phosphitoxidans DSM 13687]
MLEIYMDERGELAIENMEALIKAFPQFADRATASALKSEGFRLKNLIADAIRSGGPSNAKWDDLNPHTGVLSRKRGKGGRERTVKNYRMVWKGEKGSKRRVRQYKDVMLSTRTKPLARLAGAVRYNYDKDLEAVSIGFIQNRGVSDSMLSLARLHAKGEKTRVTPRMRKMMFALGFPIKKTTTTLETPARPVIDPVFRAEKDTIPKNIEQKFLAAIRRYMEAKEK